MGKACRGHRRGPICTPPGDAVHFPSVLELAAGRHLVHWLWPGWIPRGMLTLLAAAPGSGRHDPARRWTLAPPPPPAET